MGIITYAHFAADVKKIDLALQESIPSTHKKESKTSVVMVCEYFLGNPLPTNIAKK